MYIFTYSRTDARGAWAQFLVKVHSIFVYLAKSDFNVEFDLCGTNWIFVLIFRFQCGGNESKESTEQRRPYCLELDGRAG